MQAPVRNFDMLSRGHLLGDEAALLAHGEGRLQGVALAGREERQQRPRLVLCIQLHLCVHPSMSRGTRVTGPGP